MDTLAQSFRMAVKSIGGNKLRAFLTMLGIIIGVMALVIMVSLVNGATSSVTDAISTLGTNSVMVNVSDDKGKPLSLQELDAMALEEGIGEITVSTTQTNSVFKHGSTSKTGTLHAVTPSYFRSTTNEMLLGRSLLKADEDNHSEVCVLSETAATEVIGYKDCLGEVISINGHSFTVVGVREDDKQTVTSVIGFSMKPISHVYVPYTSFIRLSTSVKDAVSAFELTAQPGRTMAEAEAAVKAILFERFDEDEDAYAVTNMNAIEETTNNVTNIFTVLLGGVAAISLIVGGIGIMNIMLVTVTERTREIGIRKAIGASRGVILVQFLMESTLLCMLGCALGIFLSWSVLQAASVVVSSLGLSFVLNGKVVLTAVAFCFVIGVGFGLYPADKAARMKPIDALHYGG